MSAKSSGVVPIPPFNLQKSLKHWLRKLQEDYNRIERNTKIPPTHQLVPTPLVEYIFITSKQLDLALEVKYLAVDLFDRYLRNQYISIYSEVFAKLNEHALKRWAKVENKICSQLELRILSCLQIASKLISEGSDSKILSSKEINTFLDEGKLFSIRDINNSEFRVFETLQFQVFGSTIITFVDAMIVNIYQRLYGTSEFQSLQKKCYDICEILYLNHQEIFIHFYHKLTGLWERSFGDRSHFCSVECNGLVKGAAVILTAAKLSLSSEKVEKNLKKRLSELTSSDESDFANKHAFEVPNTLTSNPEWNVSLQKFWSQFHQYVSKK